MTPGTYEQTLRVDDLVVRFGAVRALDGVSFRVDPGSIHGIIGPNGAGKSTMLNVLSGVYSPASGTVRLGDINLVGMRPHKITRLGLARTFQNLALSGNQSVLENLMLGRHSISYSGFLRSGLALRSSRVEERIHRERVAEIAYFLGIDKLLNSNTNELSYGDQKRVEIARALAMEPKILLLDEPVAGMNAGEKRYIAELILKIAKSLAITVVLVEHDMEVVMSLCDRITVLDFGRRIADGTPLEIQADPAVIDAYLGVQGARES